jgi:hypothetical protein
MTGEAWMHMRVGKRKRDEVGPASLFLLLGKDGIVELRKRRELLLVDELELQTSRESISTRRAVF